jgi:hypothetical protein
VLICLSHITKLPSSTLWIGVTSNGAMVDRSTVDDVWHKHIPSKVSLLVWRLLHNCIPTKDNLEHRGVISSADTSCVFGCGSIESAEHLFLHFTMAGNLWALVCTWLGISYVHAGELRHHFFNSLRWRECLLLLSYISGLFGLPPFGWFGRKGITAFSRILFPTL